MKLFKKTQAAAMNKITGSLTGTPPQSYVQCSARCSAGSDSNTTTAVVSVGDATAPGATSAQSSWFSMGSSTSSPIVIPCLPTEVAAIKAALINWYFFTGYSWPASQVNGTKTIYAMGVARTITLSRMAEGAKFAGRISLT